MVPPGIAWAKYANKNRPESSRIEVQPSRIEEIDCHLEAIHSNFSTSPRSAGFFFESETFKKAGFETYLTPVIFSTSREKNETIFLWTAFIQTPHPGRLPGDIVHELNPPHRRVAGGFFWSGRDCRSFLRVSRNPSSARA